jgi:hypothetical protein
MSKYRAGLHKEVSAIFNGVSLPKDDGIQQSSAGPAPGYPDYVAPEPPASEQSAQKPPAPSYMTSTEPKSQQPPVQLPPKAAPAEQPKIDSAIKRTLEQIKNKLFAPRAGVSATRQKVMMMLAPALFIILISMFIRAFSTPSKKIDRLGISGPARVAASSDSKADWRAPEPYPTALRDPMRFGSVTTRTEVGGLIVKGIVYSKDKPSAVIGNQIVHEGDKVLDVTVIKINENSVEFEANGKRWTQKVQR